MPVNIATKNALITGGIVLACALACTALYRSSHEPVIPKNETRIIVSDSNTRNIYAPPLPQTASFCGETADLSKADLRERFDRELIANMFSYGGTLITLKRTKKYFPVIEPILKAHGVPDDFKYLCVAESALSNAISPSNAVGFWQFLEETGKHYGLEINEEIDERYNVEKSTEAACRYLKEAKQNFGNWTLAAASYNAGINGVQSQIDIQKNQNFYDLLMNQETSRYLFRIMALKYILEKPYACGYYLNDSDYYQPVPTKTLEIKEPVKDFADFAGEQGSNYKLLKLHNPWLRKPYLSNKTGKVYKLYIETLQ